jgi:probable HAF family extracellular repeat protein
MNKMNKKLALALSALLAGPFGASAAPVYSVTVLPDGFFGARMNQAGHVVSFGPSGFVRVWSEAGIKELAALSTGLNDARGINNRDDVAGTASYQGNFGVAFANIGGVVHNVGAAAPDFGNSDALGINDSNWVVGTLYGGRDGSVSRPYLYRNGNIRILSAPGSNAGSATAISNRGYVTGWSGYANSTTGFERRRAFLYRNGKMIGLGTLAGDNSSVGSDVNERGVVAGRSYKDNGPGSHGFVYSGGKMVNVGSLGGSFTIASGVNNAAVVVGWSNLASTRQHGFIYAFGRIVDLNTLVDPRSGWEIIAALSINDRYQILADAIQAGTGVSRSVRLEPPAGTSNYRIPPFILDFGKAKR